MGFKLADQFKHLRHIIGRARFMIGPLYAQRIGILVHEGDETVGQLTDALAVFIGPLDDLVVDIGNVTHIGQIEATGAQPALHHVEHHEHPRMPQMAVVVNSHAADVHADFARLDGNKILFFPRQGVIDFQHFRTRSVAPKRTGEKGKNFGGAWDSLRFLIEFVG